MKHWGYQINSSLSFTLSIYECFLFSWAKRVAVSKFLLGHSQVGSSTQ